MQLQLQLRQQQLRLQQLHLEKQRQLTKEKEQELTRQTKFHEMLRNNPAQYNALPSGGVMLGGNIHDVNQQMASTGLPAPSPMTTPDNDPFLGVANAGADNTSFPHPRQKSNDSGLGGMNSSFSSAAAVTARTPDKFLNNVDEMETSESMVPMAMLSPSSADGTLLDGDAGLSNAAVFMDGDELEPTISSLQSDDNLLPDINMDDVLPSVLGGGTDDSSLTWL